MIDEVEQKRQEERKERTANATMKAQALGDLMFGESIQMTLEEEVRAVPGGWIFYRTHKAGICSTFVPHPQPQRAIKTQPSIVMPD